MEKQPEGYPKEEVHDDYYFSEDRIERLLHGWIEDKGNVLDHNDLATFTEKQDNKYRTAWFSGIIGAVSIMLEEEMIKDPDNPEQAGKDRQETERQLKALITRLEDVKAEKGRRARESNERAENDVMMTEDDIKKGEELLRLVEPYAVRLDVSWHDQKDKEVS